MYENIKEKQIEILKEFHKICFSNKIQYFVGYGTLLGTVRHNGFIPWDDDVDILLLREDYEKILKILKKELPKNLFLQTYETDKFYPNSFAKIRMNNTYYIEKSTSNIQMHKGIFIDLFPIDKTSDNKAFRYIHRKSVRFMDVLLFYKNMNIDMRTPYIKFLRYILSLIPRKYIENTFFNICTFYLKRNTQHCVAFFATNKNFAFKESDLYPVINMKFETLIVPVMNNYDYYLKMLYGNYMEFPPLEERKTRHEIIEVKIL